MAAVRADLAPDLVIRLADVALDRPTLESALRIAVDRHEPAHHGKLYYAQINPPFEEATWSLIADWLKNVGPLVRSLIESRVVGSATVDIAMLFPDNVISRSITVPAIVAQLAGQNLIDVEISSYLSSSGA